MFFQYDGNDYEILVEKKRETKNTYIRVKQDLKIYITTNKYFNMFDNLFNCTDLCKISHISKRKN